MISVPATYAGTERKRGRHGKRITEIHPRVQAEGGRPVQAKQHHLRRGGARAGIDPGSLSNWVRRADSAGAAGGAEGANPFELAEENCRLRREAARPEREILLKASAFFASMQL